MASTAFPTWAASESEVSDAISAVDLPGLAARLHVIPIRLLVDDVLRRSTTSQRKFMTENSYLHENGFERITLPLLDPALGAVRFHLWERNQPVERTPHNHRWPFVSRIIAGSLTNVVMEADYGGGPHTHYSHSPADAGYLFRMEGCASLSVVGRERFEPGRTYGMHPPTIHDVDTSLDRRTLTLVLELPDQQPTTSVFALQRSKPTGEIVRRRRMSWGELAARLREAQELGGMA